MGINLGASPRHESCVALILILQKGLMLPQLNVQFDDLFVTVRLSSNKPLTFSQWQVLSVIDIKSLKGRNTSGVVTTEPETFLPDKKETPQPAPTEPPVRTENGYPEETHK